MSIPSAAELDHSAFEMGFYASSPGAMPKAAASTAEDTGMKGMAASSSRVSRIGEFFSGIVLLANRAISAVARAGQNLWQGLTAFRYRNASGEFLQSLKTAIDSRDPDVIKDQCLGLVDCQRRQRVLLKPSDAPFAEKMREEFRSQLRILISDNEEMLKEHSSLMLDLSYNHQFRHPVTYKEAEYLLAHKVIAKLFKVVETVERKNQSQPELAQHA